jgi:CheY-like chemotaxis protein
VKVLCVDDEPDLLYLFSFVLTRSGHEVVQAANGAEALERIAESRPDVIVTDLMMPVMDGRELIERLRADPATADIPILLVSATPDVQVAADAVLPKMHGPKRMLEMVEGLQRGIA